MRMMSLPHSDLAPGADEQPLLRTSGGTALATMICYEDAYAAEQLYALPTAGVLVNVSNDAWFGDSIAPHQHMQIARMRALETGRPMIRATNTGISAFIDHEGRVVRQGAQFEEVAMTETVRPRVGSTPYVDSGNRPLIGLCLVLLGLFWLRTRF
jgi:apolipoprotein N-acyltransferase